MNNKEDLKLQKVLKKNENIVSRQIADEYILVPIRKTAGSVDSIYTLNDVASFLWESIDGIRSVSELVDMVISEYDIGRDEVIADVLELLNDFSEIGVVL